MSTDGRDGRPGLPGLTGLTGLEGGEGVEGVQGAEGDKGPEGDQGPRGDRARGWGVYLGYFLLAAGVALAFFYFDRQFDNTARDIRDEAVVTVQNACVAARENRNVLVALIERAQASTIANPNPDPVRQQLALDFYAEELAVLDTPLPCER